MESSIPNLARWAVLTLFGQNIKIWLISWAFDAYIISNKWSINWTWLFACIHILSQCIFWGLCRCEYIWFSCSIWLVVSNSSINTCSAAFVEGLSTWTGHTFTGSDVKNRFWIIAGNTLESIPERSIVSTIGGIIVDSNSVDIILDKIIHGNSTQDPWVFSVDICLVWSWANQKICCYFRALRIGQFLGDIKVLDGVISVG